MTPDMTIPLSIGGFALAGLLLAEQRQAQRGLWLFKPVAAAAYIWVALVHGATSGAFGIAVLVALLLSWCGDVLLIPKNRPAVFRAGIIAFLAAHIAFVAAFLVRGVNWPAFVIAALLLSVPGFAVWRWLAGQVPASLNAAVRFYIVVITVMLAAAIATHIHAPAPIIVLGAAMFWVSDLFVARDRFVAPGFVNRLLGLPLYFAAQLLLAISVAIP